MSALFLTAQSFIRYLQAEVVPALAGLSAAIRANAGREGFGVRQPNVADHGVGGHREGVRLAAPTREKRPQ
jgi:hypothetical protein